MNINFCDFSVDEKSFIKEMFSKSFNIKSFERLFKCYETFSENFQGISKADKIETIPRPEILPKTTQMNLLNNFNNKPDYQIGIDLPVLLRNSGTSIETVL